MLHKDRRNVRVAPMQTKEALKRLQKLQRAATQRSVRNYAFALAYEAIDDKAIEWLERAYHDHPALRLR